MKPVVIHDPDLNLSAIVDTETFQGWGPAMPGPDGQRLLGDWLDTLPDDPAGLSGEAACSWFLAHLQTSGELPSGAAEASPAGQDGAGPAQPAHEVALADREAQQAADGPPAVQPADTDPTAEAGPTEAAPSGTSEIASGAADAGSGNGEPAATSTPEASPDAGAISPPPATVQQDCPTCNGTGTFTYDGENGPISQQCQICQGSGKVAVEA